MTHFERMVAIPEDEYNQLRSVQQVHNPGQQQFTKLSNQYDRQNFIQDPYTRVHRQGETLDEMKKLKEDLRERVRQATPRPYQSRAESLYDFLKNKLSFSEKGEIHDNDNKAIVDSNITDLIQHAVRDRRRNMTPVGWKSFLTTLQSTNAPKMLLSYDTLEELRAPKSVSATTIKPSKLPRLSSSFSGRRLTQEFVHLPRSRVKKTEKKIGIKKRSRSTSGLRKEIKKPDYYLFSKKYY
jgi:hypothetical protein